MICPCNCIHVTEKASTHSKTYRLHEGELLIRDTLQSWLIGTTHGFFNAGRRYQMFKPAEDPFDDTVLTQRAALQRLLDGQPVKGNTGFTYWRELDAVLCAAHPVVANGKLNEGVRYALFDNMQLVSETFDALEAVRRMQAGKFVRAVLCPSSVFFMSPSGVIERSLASGKIGACFSIDKTTQYVEVG